MSESRPLPLRQTGPDRFALVVVDREMCAACGELPARYGIHCRRCAQSLEEDRLERESGR